MAVECFVISGARQGERITLDADEVVAGGERDCDLYFDPARDGPARGTRLRIRREEDGWRIRNLGGGRPMLNHDFLHGAASIRSGDIVRLSEEGPDFRFAILVGGGASPASRAAAREPSPAAPARPFPATRSQPPPLAPQIPGEVEPSAHRGDEPGATVVTPNAWQPRQVVLGAAIAIGAVAVVLLLVGLVVVPIAVVMGNRSGTEQADAGSVQAPSRGGVDRNAGGPRTDPPPADESSQASAPAISGKSTAPRDISARPVSVDPGSAGASPGAESTEPRPADRQSADPRASGPPPAPGPPPRPPAAGNPVVLLAVGKPAGQPQRELRPLALACAIRCSGRQILLTTAHVATLVAQYPMKYWAAAVDASGSALVEVDASGARVHRIYLSALTMDDPAAARFFDLGTLDLRGELPFTCRVASRDDVLRMKQDTRLWCFGLSFTKDDWIHLREGRVIDFRPSWLQQPWRTVSLRRRLPLVPEPEARELFELDVKTDPYVGGSFLVNEQGLVVAVCNAPVEAASGSADSPERTQYATAAPIDAEMVDSREQWIPWKPTGREKPAKN